MCASGSLSPSAPVYVFSLLAVHISRVYSFVFLCLCGISVYLCVVCLHECLGMCLCECLHIYMCWEG